MPATAAIDNETLDHLLSVVDDGANIAPPQRFGRRALSGMAMSRRRTDEESLPPQLPHRLIEPLQSQRIHSAADELAHHLDRSGQLPFALGHRIEPDAGRIGGG